MTDEQIFEIAKQHLNEWEYEKNEELDWFCNDEQLIQFVKAIYDEGYDQGCFEATGGNG